MLEYFDRIDELATKSRRIPNVQACTDLIQMCNTAHSIGTELSKELVECRRRNKLSPKSQSLLEDLEESIDNIEKMLTYATLIYGSE